MWSVGGGVVYIPATFNAEEGLRKGMATTDKNKGGIPDWGEWPVVWGGGCYRRCNCSCADPSRTLEWVQRASHSLHAACPVLIPQSLMLCAARLTACTCVKACVTDGPRCTDESSSMLDAARNGAS